MKCPDCGSDDAYIGMFDVDCPNENCKNYQGNPVVATPTQAVPTSPAPTSNPVSPAIPSFPTRQPLTITIITQELKKSSVLLSFTADGDPGYPDKVVEFLWWLPGSTSKNICTLSSKYRYYVKGVDANGINVYKTHWRCTHDGLKPTDSWSLEARIS